MRDFGIVQRHIRVEDRLQIHGRDQRNDNQEDLGNYGAPDPPCALQTANHTKQQDSQDSAQNETNQQALELIAHPRRERLGCQSVPAFAKVAFIDGEREAEDGSDDKVLQPIESGLQWFEPRDFFGQIPHRRRPTQLE